MLTTQAPWLVAAGLLLDGIGNGELDVDAGRVVAGPEHAQAPPAAELRARVLADPPDTPRGWIERAAGFAPERVAVELIAAGLAVPLPRGRLSVDARAQGAARRRLEDGPLAAFLTPLPPATHALPPAVRAIVQAMRSSAIDSNTWTYASTDASSWVTESVHSSSRPGVMKIPRFML